MGMIKVEVSHTLSIDEAKSRMQGLFDFWVKKYGVKATWQADKASFAGKMMGVTFEGYMLVSATRVGGEATDPGFLLRGKTTDYLQRKLAMYLDASKTLQQIQASE
jgi:hypothetical protein